MTAKTEARTDRQALLPHHQALIEASAISPAVAEARGYWSARTKSQVRQRGFSDGQCLVPALVVPVWDVRGEIATYQIRPDEPRVKDGKPLKYETPAKTRMVLDVPPLVREQLRDPSIPLFITEGVRKADAAASIGLCCIDVLGVWNFRGTNEYGGKTALADWESIALNQREVYLCFDSDAMTKRQVGTALGRLKAFLESREARVRVVYLPPGAAGEKVGLDDYLAAGHGVTDLLAHATDTLRAGESSEEEGAGAGPYRETETGLVWMKPTQHGDVLTPLTNFSARIVEQVLEDDGAETRRLFEVEARLRGRSSRFRVSAPEFPAMGWPMVHLGAGAVVYAGFGLKDHARAAVQSLSGDPEEQTVYTHTGWRQVGDKWCYLSGGGAVGAGGLVEGVSVALPGALDRFMLTAPPEGERLMDAVRASLDLLGVAPEVVTIPLLCAIWRAPLGACDFSLHLTGATGAGKTALAALAQQHWGPGLDGRHLPGSWSSTGNALEALAFHTKDALLVVDDFAPGGTTSDVARLHREAGRLLRAQGNRSGRQRMRADTSLRPAKPPRGLILSTGEDVPRGESLGARVLVLELGAEALDFAGLGKHQDKAARGLFAEAMAGYVEWLAGRYEALMGPGGTARRDMVELRQRAAQSGMHRRMPDIMAGLAFGLRQLLEFAQQAGALSATAAAGLWERGWRALGEAASRQSAHQSAAHPGELFLRLVRAAVVSGVAHLADVDGEAPQRPEAWGWRREADAWRAQGKRIGWVEAEHVYLEPAAAYASANTVGQGIGEVIPVQPRTLHKRLSERGLLASEDRARRTHTVRKSIGGRRPDVLHLRAEVLLSRGESDQTDQGTLLAAEEAESGRTAGQIPPLSRSGTDQGNCPEEVRGGGKGDGAAEVVSLGGSVEVKRVANGSSAGATDGAAEVVRPCYACGGIRFWRHRDGGPRICERCHPPADESVVAEWLEVDGNGENAAAKVLPKVRGS